MLSLLFLISIQLISESFPVSSSGHIAIALSLFFSKNSAKLLSLSAVLHLPEIVLWMNVPMIVIVAVFFVKEWWFFLVHLRDTWRIVLKLIGYMLCSNVITALLYISVQYYKLMMSLSLGFTITGVLLISLRFCSYNGRAMLSVKRSLLLGLVQGGALFPGISRFAAVFVVSRWMGIDARRSFSITWMLSGPLR